MKICIWEWDAVRIIARRTSLVLLLLMPVMLNSAPNEVQLLSIGNSAAVQNNPSRLSRFTLDSSFVITYLYTYHWNNGNGTNPGTIALRNQHGKMYGPYKVNGRPGQDGVPNALWDVNLNIIVPAGTYTIVDSEPATWSCNAESGNKGFAIVRGYRKHHKNH